MKKFELNGKKYEVVPMTFNTMCQLEDLGISLDEFNSKRLSFARAYISIASGLELDEVGVEIEKHMKNGGELKDIYEVIAKEIEESDFFLSIQKSAEEKAQEMAEETSTSSRKAKVTELKQEV